MKKNFKKSHYNLNRKLDVKIKIISIFIIIVFSCIFLRISYLNIFRGKYYQMLLSNYTNTYTYGDSAPRGRIYDRNYNLLVDNIAVKSIYYIRSNEVSIKDEILLAYKVSKVLDLDYKELNIRNLKEFYLINYEEECNKKITNIEYTNYKNRKLTSNDLYELKIDRITDEDLNIFTDKDKKAAYLYFLMNNGYYYEEKNIKKSVSEEEYAYILENMDSLKGFKTKLEWERVYLYKDTLRNVLGDISKGLPKENLNYYLEKGYAMNDVVGISGLEKEYEEILKGTKAKYKLLDDNSLELISEGSKGNDIVLSIDINLQKDIEKMIDKELIKTKKEPNTEFYNRSFVVIEKPNTGEILAMIGRKIIKSNGKYEIYDFSEGAIISTVTPGSVVKGASMIVGYNTKAIEIGTIMEDKCIKLFNLPSKCSWKTLGSLNDIGALQWSSNVYQYKIAMKVGGFNYSYNKVLKINPEAFNTYRNIFYQFGLGIKTGIDYPNEEDGYKGESVAGDLLINYAIGQYDTYTPLQLSQYVTTIANNGNRVKPHLLKSVLETKSNKVIYEVTPVILNKVETEDKYIKRVQLGFNKVMSVGTGRFGYMGKSVEPAGKTGTSESFIDVDGDGIIDNETVTNNFVGYAPYDNPIMSIAVSSPDVQNPNRGSFKTSVNLRISKQASDIFFKYYDDKGNKIR